MEDFDTYELDGHVSMREHREHALMYLLVV